MSYGGGWINPDWFRLPGTGAAIGGVGGLATYLATALLLQQMCERRKAGLAGLGGALLGGVLGKFIQDTLDTIESLIDAPLQFLAGLVDGALAQLEALARSVGLGLIADFFSRLREVLRGIFASVKGVIPMALVFIVIAVVARRYFLR